jgi:hypothetical protein
MNKIKLNSISLNNINLNKIGKSNAYGVGGGWEEFLPTDGSFILVDGGTFNVKSTIKKQ